MDRILQYASDNRVPIVRPNTLKLLLDTIKENSSKNILEIGTAIGYSGINMLLNSNAHLTTIEKNEEMYNISCNNFKSFNLQDRVTQYLGDAKDVLQHLVDKNEKYDFVFLDGPKGQYLGYLPLLEQLLSDGGIIFADDVLFYGLVKGDAWPKHKKRTIVLNLRKYLNEVNLPPFTSQIIDIEDGICITRKEKK